MQEPDPHVVGAARNGDLDAFGDLVVRYQADVWRLAVHLVHDQTLADDVTQETFVRAFRFLSHYRGEAKFSTWLFSITRNCALDELRKADRRRRTCARLYDQPRPKAPDHSVGVEVREALSTLSIELREPIVLIDMLGVTYDEVSVMLSVPLGTVKSRVHRARDILARTLHPSDEELADEG